MQKRTWKSLEDVSNVADYADVIAEETEESLADGFSWGAEHAYDEAKEEDWFEE